MAGRQLLIGTVFPAAFDGQTVSIDFDGSTEELKSGEALVGIANTWTIACWAKVSNVSSRQDTLFEMFAGISGENIRLFQRSNVGTAPSYQFFSDTNNVAWTSLPISNDVWHHVVLQWDNGTPRGSLFIDASDQGAPGFGSLVSQTFTDVSRSISIAEAASGVPNLDGRVASMAIWDALLTSAEITTIYNSGSIAIDLLADSGSYVSSANLQHWFQLGRDSTDIGKDSGIGSPLFDLMAAQTDITTDDIVTDAPA